MVGKFFHRHMYTPRVESRDENQALPYTHVNPPFKVRMRTKVVHTYMIDGHSSY